MSYIVLVLATEFISLATLKLSPDPMRAAVVRRDFGPVAALQFPHGAKDRAGLDVVAQVGYLLVFVLSCWLCHVPLSPWPLCVFGALFAMRSHLFGQIRGHRVRRQATVVCGGQTAVAHLGKDQIIYR